MLGSRALRARLTGEPADEPRRGRVGGPSRSAAAPTTASASLPTGVARTLTSRGLVNSKQLASMSAPEREFFLVTMAAKLGDGTKPRLVGQPTPRGNAAVAAQPGEAVEPLPAAALVTGSIHCPVCRTPIGKRGEQPLQMSRCPGCSRRVAVRVEGARLSVTVDYTLGTPASGVGKIKE